MKLASENQIRAFKETFSRKSLVGLGAAVLVVLVPYVFCIALVPLYASPPVGVTATFNKFAFFGGIGWGVAYALLVALPSIFWLRYKNKSALVTYTLLAAVSNIAWSSIVPAIFGWPMEYYLVMLGFAGLLPVVLATTTYWYISIRKEKHIGALIWLILLFGVWIFFISVTGIMMSFD